MTWTRLHDACQHHNNKMIVKLARCFVEEAVMVDDHGSTPLHIACWGNPPMEVVHALLQACPQAATDKDVHGNTPLHVAASYPETSPAIARAFLDVCPAAASITNKEGLTPLHMACRFAPKNELFVALLIYAFPFALRHRTKMGEPAPRKKRSVEQAEMQHFVTDKAGKSNLAASATLYALAQQVRDGSYPLHMAIQAGTSRNVVELILGGEEGEDLLLLTNKHGETPLHIALANPIDEELVDLLTEGGHSFEMMRMQEKQHGDLPVHIAATHGCSVAVAKKLLRIHPNSIHEKNKDSKTPLDLVLEQGHCSEQVIRLFDISDHSECSLE